MGEMVGSHLLTAEDVGRTLEKEGFRRELKGAVADKLGAFLDRDLGTVENLVPAEFRGRFRELVELLRWKTVKAIFAYLESADFETALRAYLRGKGDELLARDLESYLTPERYAGLRGHLDGKIGEFLGSDHVGRGVAAFVDAKSEEWLATQKLVRDLLPADLVELLLGQLEKEIPPLLEKFGGLLYDPVFRERLVVKGKEAIEGFLDSLGGLSGLLTGFLNLDKIYARIPEFLDKAGDEIARWLREERTQGQVSALLRERVDGFLDKPLAVYLEKLPYEKVAGVRRYLRQRAVAAVQSRRATETALGLLEKGIDQVKDRSFASLLGRALPDEAAGAAARSARRAPAGGAARPRRPRGVGQAARREERGVALPPPAGQALGAGAGRRARRAGGGAVPADRRDPQEGGAAAGRDPQRLPNGRGQGQLPRHPQGGGAAARYHAGAVQVHQPLRGAARRVDRAGQRRGVAVFLGTRDERDWGLGTGVAMPSFRARLGQ